MHAEFYIFKEEAGRERSSKCSVVLSAKQSIHGCGSLGKRGEVT